MWRTYDFSFRGKCRRGSVIGQDGHAHHEGAAGGGVVRVEVGQVGEVDGGGVVDRLESAGGVEVADGLGGFGLLLLGGGRTF